ncbi:MAG: hypothetical protein ABSA21_13530 [Candidatus Limnocylindrales bacterium]|jgi:tetratricopeptide (TPR) repeat protein
MRISLALLADHAIAHPTDGKLYITGGGLKSLPFAAFPAVLPHLALALGIEVGPEELGIVHTLSIEASGPTDEVIFRPVTVTFTMPRRNDQAKAVYFHFVANMDNVAFPVEGDYAFSIAIDTEQLERVEVRAERTGDVHGTMEANAPVEARTLLRDGYNAFNQGDLPSAEAIFRMVAARFPMFPDGHNNLGFVLLANGDARAALEAFAKAKELRYAQPEINDANMACAMYLSGDAAEAQRVFTDCIQTHLLRSSATLFGIGPSGLFPVGLRSAADYATLMALNAAWSAQVAGDVSEMSHYLESARAGELSRRADATGKQFVESLSALEAKARITP